MTGTNGILTSERPSGPESDPNRLERPAGSEIGEREPGTGRDATAGPITIIDSSEIREGQLDRLRAAMSELVEFARTNEPRMIAYSVYLNEDATLVTVMQVHPDSASAEFHMQVAGSVFAGFVELVRLSRIDVYGSPSPELLERLRRKAGMLGSGTVAVHELHAGFARFGAPDAAAPK